jgi:hypothetical protein
VQDMSAVMNVWSGLRVALVHAATVAAALVVAAAAQAQGTWGMVPDPISSGELAKYLQRLGASEPQRQAAAAMHDQYKSDYKRLRETDVEKLMTAMRALQGGGGLPKRKDVENFIDARAQVLARVESLDNAMFNNLQPLLAEHQMAMLPRVKMARARARYTTNETRMMTGAQVDLSDLVTEIDLTGEDLASIDPIMQGYEVRLTRASEELHDRNTKMWLEIMDALEAAGYRGEDDMHDPERAGKIMETMQNVMRDATKKGRETGAEIAKLHRQTYRAVAPNLAPETARAFAGRFFAAAYAETFQHTAAQPPPFDRALKIKDLSDDQRGDVAALRDQYEASNLRLLEAAADLIDAHRAEFSVFDFNGESLQKHQEQLQANATQRGELATKAGQSLASLVGTDMAAKLASDAGDEKPGAADAGENPPPQTASAPEDDADRNVGPDPNLPGAIRASDAARYARLIGLSADDQPILDALVNAHQQEYDQLARTELKPLQEAQQGFWNLTPASDADVDSRLDKLHRARAAALAAIQKLDEQFLSDVQTTLLDDSEASRAAVQRIRLARLRDAFRLRQQQQEYAGWGQRNASDTIDLSDLLARQKLEVAALRATDPVLIPYEQSLTNAMKLRYEAAMRSLREQERFGIAMLQAQGDAAEVGRLNAKYQESWRETGRAVAAAGTTIAALNEATLPKLVDALPSDGGIRVREAFERRAFPSVYVDSRSAQPKIDSALALPDLTAEQRRELQSIALAFRGDYDQLSRKMVEMTAGQHDDFSQFQQDDWQEYMKSQSAMSKLRFDRDEASAAAIRRMRAALNPEQVKALGGLEEPQRRSDNPFVSDE